jgi:hypothetical protein
MRVVITNLIYDGPNSSFWYKIGEIYEVEPYRHNPERYWEVKGWNGDSMYFPKFWIMKKHTSMYYETYNLPEELFTI